MEKKFNFDDGTSSLLKKVPGFLDLWINTDGTVVVNAGKLVNIGKISNHRNNGYMVVSIDGHMEYVHQLVALAYHGKSKKPLVMHLDCNTTNNFYKNLVFATYKELRINLICNKKISGSRENFPGRVASKIPESDVAAVVKRLKNGETLRQIANDYNTSDMSIVRLKKRYLSKKEIDKINKKKGINTNRMPKETVEMIVRMLKEGRHPQNIIAKMFATTPTVVCRINRIYIRKC